MFVLFQLMADVFQPAQLRRAKNSCRIIGTLRAKSAKMARIGNKTAIANACWTSVQREKIFLRIESNAHVRERPSRRERNLQLCLRRCLTKIRTQRISRRLKSIRTALFVGAACLLRWAQLRF